MTILDLAIHSWSDNNFAINCKTKKQSQIFNAGADDGIKTKAPMKGALLHDIWRKR